MSAVENPDAFIMEIHFSLLILLKEFLCFNLLMEWMSLYLIHRRNNLIERDNVHYSVRLKIAYANGA